MQIPFLWENKHHLSLSGKIDKEVVTDIKKIRIGPIKDSSNRKEFNEMLSIIKNLSVQKLERKNTEFNYSKNNWTKFVWQTAAADLKSRHFKWDPQGKEIDSQTGRINKIVFKEI